MDIALIVISGALAICIFGLNFMIGELSHRITGTQDKLREAVKKIDSLQKEVNHLNKRTGFLEPKE